MSNTPGALIAMSGGVDSTVAAYLMKQAGYRCMGATMRLYQNEDLGQSGFHTCCSAKDVEDAAEVAFQPHAALGRVRHGPLGPGDDGADVVARYPALGHALTRVGRPPDLGAGGQPGDGRPRRRGGSSGARRAALET